MGWLVGTALSAAARAEMQKVYGWLGAVLWQSDPALHDPSVALVFRIAMLVAGSVCVLLLIIEAGFSRPGPALARLLLATAGAALSLPIAEYLIRLDRAVLAVVAGSTLAHAIPSPPAVASVIDVLVFGVPYLLLLVVLSCVMLARMAMLVALVATAPFFWLLSVASPLRRLPHMWLLQTSIWALLPAAESFLLVLTRGLAGELGLPVPASDMLLGLVVLYLMVRLPFALLRMVPRWSGR